MSTDSRMTDPLDTSSPALSRAVIIIFLLILAVVTGLQVLDVMNYSYFHEEVRGLQHYDPARVSANDYAAQYLAKTAHPVLYLYMTKLALAAGVDLVTYHKLLSVLCMAVLLAGGALIGKKLAGNLGAVVVACLIALQPIYQYQITSATPHAWGYPLLVLGLACMMFESVLALALVTLLTALLYPAMAPLLGLCLLWQVLWPLRGRLRQRGVVIRNLLVLGLTGVVTLLLVRGQLIPMDGFGAAIAIGDMSDVYPENGPQGRHFYGVFRPFAYVIGSIFGQFRQVLPPTIISFVMFAMLGVSGYGLWLLRRRKPEFTTFVGFLLVSAVICIVFAVLRPHLSYRFLLYPLFVVLPPLFVYGSIGIGRLIKQPPAAPVVVTSGILLVVAASLNQVDAKRNGLQLQLDQDGRKLVTFVKEQPSDTLIASWPAHNQTDLIPYLTGRPLLVVFKAHYPTHVDHIMNMRARMYDLIDAYLSSDVALLMQLRCKWGVRLVIADRRHFDSKEDQPTYFEPFRGRIESRFAEVDAQSMILHSPPENAIAFRSGDLFAVDLNKLGGECPE